MAEHGWWAGDLDVRQRHEDLPLLMRAAGVSIAPEFAGENVRENVAMSECLPHNYGDQSVGSTIVAAADCSSLLPRTLLLLDSTCANSPQTGLRCPP